MLHPDGRSYLMFSKMDNGTTSIFLAKGDASIRSMHMSRDCSVDTTVDIIMHHIKTVLVQDHPVVTFNCNLYKSSIRCEYSSKHIDDILLVVHRYVEAIRACENVIETQRTQRAHAHVMCTHPLSGTT